MTEALIELSSRLQDTAARLRSGQLEPDAARSLQETLQQAPTLARVRELLGFAGSPPAPVS